MLLTFYFKFVKKKKHFNASFTSKWQTHLPCLHQESLRVLNSLSDKYKNSTNKQPTRGRHPGYTSLLCPCVESCGESPESLPVGPRSHECDNKKTNK